MLAIILVIGLAAGCSGSSDPDPGDAADADGFVRLTLPEPTRTGHTVAMAVDHSDRSIEPSEHHGATEQAAAGAEDPWSESITVRWSVAQGPRLWGELVDLGGVVGAIDPWMNNTHLMAVLDGRMATLASTAVPMAELQDRLRQAIAAGWSPREPLPGHDVLVDWFGAARLSLQYLEEFDPVAAVSYGAHGAPDFAVATMRGGDAEFRAMTLGDGWQPVTIRGHDGVRFTGEDATHFRWRENDRTIAAVETFEDAEAVLALLEELVPTAAHDFAAIADRYPVFTESSDPQVSLLGPPPESGEDPDPDPFSDPFGPAVSDVVGDWAFEVDGTDTQVRVFEHGGAHHLAIGAEVEGSFDDSIYRLGAPGLFSRWAGAGPVSFIGVLDAEPLAASFSYDDGPSVAIEDLVVEPFERGGSPAWLVAGSTPGDAVTDDTRLQIVTVTFATGPERRFGI